MTPGPIRPPFEPEDSDELPKAPPVDIGAETKVHDLATHQMVASGERIPVAGSAPRTPSSKKNNEDAAVWIGRRLGPYVIREFIARGGMGMVLLGYDEELRRSVAIKVMDATLMEDADAAHRFKREARASAAAPHPCIAQVFAVGDTDDGAPYMVIEYLDGGSLLDIIRNRDPLTFTQIATLMEQVCSALQAAHRQGIIHRDIKPANIMISSEGIAKVVDFGLAKLFFEDSLRTREGMVLGTPAYMAPEQSQGRVVDHRADIYSFGATFYHLVTGRPPFTGDSPVQIMMKHVTSPLVPMRSLNNSVPIEFDEIIGRCMRKDLDSRYQDYEDLLGDIKRVRLMCATREMGSFVGGPGAAVPNQPALGRAAGTRAAGTATPAIPGSTMLPPPPSHGPARVGAPGQRPAGGAAADVRFQEPAPAAEQPGFQVTAVHVAALLAVALLVFVGALTFMISRANAPDKPETTAADDPAPTKERPRFAIMIDRLKGEAEDNSPEAVAMRNYAAYFKTVAILRSLNAGVRSFQVDRNTLPGHILDIARDDRVIINFDRDEEGHPLDGWNQTVYLDPSNGDVFSAGMDGQLYTEDDILFPLEGIFMQPDAYRRGETLAP